MGDRPEPVHLQLEEEVVVVEGVADVGRRRRRERWNWQSDSSLAILVLRANRCAKQISSVVVSKAAKNIFSYE